MRSRIADELAKQRIDRLAGLSPAERVELAMHLSEQGVASYMSTHQVDRGTAIARIKASRRAGRRSSPCAVADEG